MRRFGTQGRVYPDKHYVVPRTKEIENFNMRVKDGRYIVLFAPRQTGKTTFFRMALAALSTEDPSYFPIQLDFQIMRNCSPIIFYDRLHKMLGMQIESVLQKRGEELTDKLKQFLNNSTISDDFSLILFFKDLSNLLGSDAENNVFTHNKVVLLIDEFDGIPQNVVSEFLYALRTIYLSDELHCPQSVGIVGVKSINQLNYDRSVSPFNVQDEFRLPNFTLEQIQDLFGQYTNEVGQFFAPEIIKSLYTQTRGQPFLVNRIAQILTEEMEIPKTETVNQSHFSDAHIQILREQNVNIQHLTTNVRRDRRFEGMLMNIMAREQGVDFNLDDDIISELATYGVIRESSDKMCEIVNPIYLYRIMRTFKPMVNGLENDYFSEERDECSLDYLSSDEQIDMSRLLDNFRDFITRACFRILQVPDKPKEYIGQHLLYAYLDQFVRNVGGILYLEVQTGRGRMDLLIIHNQQKYIVETKIWEGDTRFASEKKQLSTYMELEGVTEGYYVVFNHRQNPEARVETETVNGMSIRSYVIPIVQERPSSEK